MAREHHVMGEEKMKSIMLVAVVTSVVSSAGWASTAGPAKMTDAQLDQVVAGWVNPGGNPCGRSPWDCGNNGWGNGFDLTNPGSFHGLTAPSKMVNGSNGTGPNLNPTTSNGR